MYPMTEKVMTIFPIQVEYSSLNKVQEGIDLKESTYKTYDDLPLFLNAAMVAQVLGVAPSSAYELMHEKDFPTLRVGSRMVVPKEKFIEWVGQHTKGGGDA